MADDKRPIIIKKVKKGGHGHHGGAWKVAYADFVTAMMAFFLMLWLLSSVEEGKLEDLAKFFTPTIGVRDSMGIGFEGGTTANMKGKQKSDRSDPGVIIGIEATGPSAPDEKKETIIDGEKDAQLFEQAEEAIKRAFEEDPNLRDLADNIIVEQTPEGLKIEIMDSDKYPMFNPGSIQLTIYGRRTLGKMLEVIEIMPNFISITGHTDVSALSGRGDYSNWELSMDRANAARRFLLSRGMEKERPKAVTGKADTQLLLPDEPLNPRNRRITIILLRGTYMDLLPGALPATRELLSVPRPGMPTSNKVKELRQEEAAREAKPEAPKTGLTPGLAPTTSGEIGSDPVDALSAPAPGEEAPADAPPEKPDVNMEDYQEFME